MTTTNKATRWRPCLRDLFVCRRAYFVDTVRWHSPDWISQVSVDSDLRASQRRDDVYKTTGSEQTTHATICDNKSTWPLTRDPQPFRGRMHLRQNWSPHSASSGMRESWDKFARLYLDGMQTIENHSSTKNLVPQLTFLHLHFWYMNLPVFEARRQMLPLPQPRPHQLSKMYTNPAQVTSEVFVTWTILTNSLLSTESFFTKTGNLACPSKIHFQPSLRHKNH